MTGLTVVACAKSGSFTPLSLGSDTLFIDSVIAENDPSAQEFFITAINKKNNTNFTTDDLTITHDLNKKK